jgi:hypothetical protein
MYGRRRNRSRSKSRSRSRSRSPNRRRTSFAQRVNNVVTAARSNPRKILSHQLRLNSMANNARTYGDIQKLQAAYTQLQTIYNRMYW